MLVFTAGTVTLGMELSASRLLEPAFGNSQIIWAALIGLILLYLAIGSWLGGILADRYPRRRELDLTLTLAAVAVALAPALSKPVLRMAITGMADLAVGLLLSALVSVLLILSVPGVLLGVASPWAIRIAVTKLSSTGVTAGRLYAVSTAGSILGTFLPVLLLIPLFGTRWTFFILALSLLVVIFITSIRERHRWIPLAGIGIVLVLALVTNPGGAIRGGWDTAAGEVLYEDESIYNYIAVHQWGSERHLKLNEGIGLHSVYHPDMLLSEGIWDYFLLAPLLNEPPAAPEPNEYKMLLIGLAAGTVSELFTDIYGPVDITGVELDPEIIQVGEEYFDMTQPNLTAVAADGRTWLAGQDEGARFSLIAVDAYRPPYIPFQLSTLEFFQLAHDHLEESGVLAINVGRTAGNYSLVDALATTVAQVFPSVYIIDEPGPADAIGNSLLVATVQPTSLENLEQNVTLLAGDYPAVYTEFAAEASQHARIATPDPNIPALTDDHAPIEWLVHRIILDYITGG